MIKRHWILAICHVVFFFWPQAAHGQTQVVVAIHFEGNERTSSSYLQKVLPFDNHTRIAKEQIDSFAKAGKTALLNTMLFNSVGFTTQQVAGSDSLQLVYTLTERWYLYPVPYVALADRHFNEWWVDRNHDIRRIVIGASVSQNNLSGHNDPLIVTAWGGFEQRLLLDYERPFLDKSNKWGLQVHAEWTRNKNLAVTTEHNKLLYWRSDHYLKQASALSLGLSYQPSFLHIHRFNVGMLQYAIHDSVIVDFPAFLGKGVKNAGFYRLQYQFLLDRRDYRGYPMSGYLIGHTSTLFLANHVQTYVSNSRLNFHLPLGPKSSLATQSQLQLSLGSAQPYVLQRGFGWGNSYVRGYNYHVIEGQFMAIQKFSILHKLFTINKTFTWLPTQFRELSITVIPKIFVDAGYVADEQFSENGALANQLLLGYGTGLDFLTYYDTVWRLEWAMNRKGEHGLFLNFTLFIQ